MLISRNSISWDKTLCGWFDSDKHADWPLGLSGLKRVRLPNSRDLRPVSSAITLPSKRPYLFLGVTITLHNAPRLSNHNQCTAVIACCSSSGGRKRHDPRSL